jgi:glycosyltransferase involved in cell wall biosynthesis
MVCRDGRPYLAEALRSLDAQTFQDWELVFWDNGSRDGSADLARALGLRARVLGGPRELSLGAARRRAIEESRGRWVALLDADDLWRADKLERQVERMGRGDVGLCYADCDVIAANGRVLGRYSRRCRPVAGRIRHALLAENFIPTCTALFARDVCEEAGGPDPRLNAATDYELWLRMAAISPVAYDPHPLASYRIHRSNLTGDFQGAYAENREIYRQLLARNGDGSHQEHVLVRRALAALLWKWAARELIGHGTLRAVAHRSKEAWATAGGPARALADLSSCALRSIRGLGLRISMNRER